MPTFSWYELRTTDPTAARAFYIEALGLVRAGEDAQIGPLGGGPAIGEIGLLPARAAAMGAPAHWLGHVGVVDVAVASRRFVALGASPLGPTQARADGTTVALLRDPAGAVVALSSRAGPPALAWHELHSGDHAQASAIYAAMFGWALTTRLDLGSELGPYQQFAWQAGGASVGAMTDAARRPEVHDHWLFYFAVDDLDAAAAKVAASGGRVVNGPVAAPAGGRFAQCEDPQGAAFGLASAR